MTTKKISAKIESWSSNENFHALIISFAPLLRDGLVAQLDNAPGYGPGDWGFESLRVHEE